MTGQVPLLMVPRHRAENKKPSAFLSAAIVTTGNSTRVYVPGAHTRAEGGGGLYGISRRKAERKAAAAAAKQRSAAHAAQQAARHHDAKLARQKKQQKLQQPQVKVAASESANKPRHFAQPAAAAASARLPTAKRKQLADAPSLKQQPRKNLKFEEFLGDLAVSKLQALRMHCCQLMVQSVCFRFGDDDNTQ